MIFQRRLSDYPEQTVNLTSEALLARIGNFSAQEPIPQLIADKRSNQLCGDESRHMQRIDSGKGIREGTRNGDSRIGKRG